MCSGVGWSDAPYKKKHRKCHCFFNYEQAIQVKRYSCVYVCVRMRLLLVVVGG